MSSSERELEMTMSEIREAGSASTPSEWRETDRQRERERERDGERIIYAVLGINNTKQYTQT